MSGNDLFGLIDKNILVLGGGLGMGESSSLFLARAGANVAVVDIDLARAETVVEKIRALGCRGVAVAGDIFDSHSVDDVVNEARQKLGGLNAMVAVPAELTWGPFVDMSMESWEFDHARVLHYFVRYAQAVSKVLINAGEGGSIVAISSIDGVHSAPDRAAYGAAKAGLIQLTKTLAVELAPHNIRVNTVAPGIIKTTKMLNTPGAAFLDDLVKQSFIPFKRPGTPDEIGKAVLLLTSDLASYITGQTLIVDGGWTVANLLDLREVISRLQPPQS